MGLNEFQLKSIFLLSGLGEDQVRSIEKKTDLRCRNGPIKGKRGCSGILTKLILVYKVPFSTLWVASKLDDNTFSRILLFRRRMS